MYSPVYPSFVVVPGEMEIVTLGDSITLECDALALPPANYFWFLVNCDSKNDVIESISTGDGLRVAGGNLTIGPAMRSHRGCYKCVANNSLEGSNSMIEHVTTLKVSGKQRFFKVMYSFLLTSLSLPLPPAPPLPPSMVRVAASGSSFVTIAWTPVDNYPAILSYELEYTLGGLLSESIGGILATSESANITMLYPTATYAVRVRAISPSAMGEYSPVVMATTLAGVPQDGLTNRPTPEDIRTISSPNSITISWSVPEVSLS